MDKGIFRPRYSERQVTKRTFNLKIPVAAQQNGDENTPSPVKKQAVQPIPETPLPADVSVTFLASTPKPGRPQLSRRRPFTAVQDEDGYLGSSSSMGSSRSSKSSKMLKSAKKSFSSQKTKKKMSDAGGSMRNKVDTISKKRIEQVRRKRSGSAVDSSSISNRKQAPPKSVQIGNGTNRIGDEMNDRSSNVDRNDDLADKFINNLENRSLSKKQKVSMSLNASKKMDAIGLSSTKHRQMDVSSLERRKVSYQSQNISARQTSEVSSSAKYEHLGQNTAKNKNLSADASQTRNGIENFFYARRKITTSSNESNLKLGDSNSSLRNQPSVSERVEDDNISMSSAKTGKKVQRKQADNVAASKSAVNIRSAVNNTSTKNRKGASVASLRQDETIGLELGASNVSKRAAVAEKSRSKPAKKTAPNRDRHVGNSRNVAAEDDVSVDDEDDEHIRGTTVQLWQGEARKRSKKDILDVDIVWNMVSDTLQSLMTKSTDEDETSALRLLNKYLKQDFTHAINEIQEVTTVTRDVQMSRHSVKRLQKELMSLQNDRNELKLEVKEKEKQQKKNKNMEDINNFLSGLQEVIKKANSI